VDDDVLTSSGMIHLKNKTTDELLTMQKYPQDQRSGTNRRCAPQCPCSMNASHDPSRSHYRARAAAVAPQLNLETAHPEV
jgi:hypothetical protein